MIFENIVLNDLEEISGSHAGGFVGGVLNNENGIASLSNIVLNNIESIKGIGFIGGFAGWINNGTFENIALNNIKILVIIIMQVALQDMQALELIKILF